VAAAVAAAAATAAGVAVAVAAAAAAAAGDVSWRPNPGIGRQWSSTMATPDVGASQIARAELHPGEMLQWVGRPDPVALARSRRGYFWAGLLFLGFSVLWEAGAAKDSGGSPFMLLWGVPFILGGAGMVLYAPASLWLAHRIVYAVTDRRLMIVHDLAGRWVESFGRSDINALDIAERSDGSGDVVFWERVVRGEESDETRRRGFFGIAAVRDVARLVDELRQSADGEAPLKVAVDRPSQLPGAIRCGLRPGENVLWFDRQGRVGNLGGRIFGLAMIGLFVAICSGGSLSDLFDHRPPASLVIPALMAAVIVWDVMGELAALLRIYDVLYVLTDRRLIIQRCIPVVSPRSFELADITGIERRCRRNGSDDITFLHRVHGSSDDKIEFDESGLFGIEDARHVELLLTRRVAARPLALERVP